MEARFFSEAGTAQKQRETPATESDEDRELIKKRLDNSETAALLRGLAKAL